MGSISFQRACARGALVGLVGVLVACGRVGFDPRFVTPDNGGPDASDAAGFDGAAGVDDASSDGALPGAQGPDATGVDSGSRDAGPPDAGGVDSGATLPRDCAEILAANPGAESGTYRIEPVPGSPVDVFCEMGRAGGGWTRAVSFDASRDPCPGDWVRVAGTPTICAREMNVAGSRSALFQPAIPYQEVLGFALGYQRASTDAFTNESSSLDTNYVDGVSITYRDGGGQRAHLWTYASGWSEANTSQPNNTCPCFLGRPPPAFVGTDYWCESGTSGDPIALGCRLWHFGDPLWNGDHDGMACGVAAPTGWFERTLPGSTTSSIEVRLMANQVSCEDVGVAQLELFVR